MALLYSFIIKFHYKILQSKTFLLLDFFYILLYNFSSNFNNNYNNNFNSNFSFQGGDKMKKEDMIASMKKGKEKRTKAYYLKRNRKHVKTREKKKREQKRLNLETLKQLEEEELRKQKLKAEEKISETISVLEDTEQIKKEKIKKDNKIQERQENLELKEELEDAIKDLEIERSYKPEKSEKDKIKNNNTKNNKIKNNKTEKSKAEKDKTKKDKVKKENADESLKLKKERKIKNNELTQNDSNSGHISPYTKKTLKQQQEIDRRLKELNKKYKNLKYTPDTRTEEEKDWEELSKIMAKVSFNKGKTWLDILDDNDFTKIVEKVSKVKVWNAVIDSLDPDDMMKALNSMNSVSRKALNGGSIDDRVQLLGMYLKVCKDDLMV